jgi:hypothetical protein
MGERIKMKVRPYAVRCCWRCKKERVTLRKVDNLDWVCEQCEGWGKPEIGNQSKRYFKYEEKK